MDTNNQVSNDDFAIEALSIINTLKDELTQRIKAGDTNEYTGMFMLAIESLSNIDTNFNFIKKDPEDGTNENSD